MRTEAGMGVIHFEDRGGYSQGIPVVFEAEKGKEVDSPLRTSKRNQLCSHPDRNPMKLILV